jgi:alcohol oxidase
VGLNFQDHYLTFSVFRAQPNVESFDDFVRGDEKTQKAVFDQWNLNGMPALCSKKNRPVNVIP